LQLRLSHHWVNTKRTLQGPSPYEIEIFKQRKLKMKDYVVWLDSETAHIYAFNGDGTEKSLLKKSDLDHHRQHKNDQHKDGNTEHFFRDLSARLRDADHLLIMGPGMAKKHFQDHLSTHEANILAKKVIGLENYEGFEHKTENEMMAAAHKFYKNYDLFHRPI
jgi:stalled ribosome rescue protein Dom34